MADINEKFVNNYKDKKVINIFSATNITTLSKYTIENNKDSVLVIYNHNDKDNGGFGYSSVSLNIGYIDDTDHLYISEIVPRDYGYTKNRLESLDTDYRNSYNSILQLETDVTPIILSLYYDGTESYRIIENDNYTRMQWVNASYIMHNVIFSYSYSYTNGNNTFYFRPTIAWSSSSYFAEAYCGDLYMKINKDHIKVDINNAPWQDKNKGDF